MLINNFFILGNTGQAKIPKGIPSGGVNITVVGTNFEYIQEPNMYIQHEGVRYNGQCKVLRCAVSNTHTCTLLLLYFCTLVLKLFISDY